MVGMIQMVPNGGWGSVSGYQDPEQLNALAEAKRILQTAVETVPQPYSYRTLYPSETYNPSTDVMVQMGDATPGSADKARMSIKRRDVNPEYATAAMQDMSAAKPRMMDADNLHDGVQKQYEARKALVESEVIQSPRFQSLINPRYGEAVAQQQGAAQMLQMKQDFESTENALDRRLKTQLAEAEYGEGGTRARNMDANMKLASFQADLKAARDKYSTRIKRAQDTIFDDATMLAEIQKAEEEYTQDRALAGEKYKAATQPAPEAQAATPVAADAPTSATQAQATAPEVAANMDEEIQVGGIGRVPRGIAIQADKLRRAGDIAGAKRLLDKYRGTQ